MLVLNFPAFKNKKYTAYDRFHGNGPYGKILTKKEPIRMLGFALPYNNCVYCPNFLPYLPSVMFWSQKKRDQFLMILLLPWC